MEKSSDNKKKSPLWKNPILWVIMIIILIIIIIPIGITIATSVISNPLKNFSTSNDWIGFFGSYIGAIIGGCITLLVMYITIENGNKNLKKNMQQNKDLQNENNIIEFCNDIAVIVAEYCGSTRVLSENLCKTNQLFSKYKDCLDEYNKFKKELEEYKRSGMINPRMLDLLEENVERSEIFLNNSKEEYLNSTYNLPKDKLMTDLFLLEIKLKDIDESKTLIEKIRDLNTQINLYTQDRESDYDIVQYINNLDLKIKDVLTEATKFINQYSKK